MQNIGLVDSHCHLNRISLEEFENKIDNVLVTAKQNGVEHLLSVCVELSEFAELVKLAEQYSEISISVGVHPDSEHMVDPDVDNLCSLASHPKTIAIGETGLDYYRLSHEKQRAIQQQRFRNHIRAALMTKKPLIIHTRQAQEDTIKIIIEEKASDIGGVMHCFTENWEMAQQALDLNFYISFSGIVTFKNATILHDVAKKMPSDRMLIETDSPYLAPAPFRGKQNHPAYVRYVAERLAELRQESYDAIVKQTTENFYRCFRLERIL